MNKREQLNKLSQELRAALDAETRDDGLIADLTKRVNDLANSLNRDEESERAIRAAQDLLNKPTGLRDASGQTRSAAAAPSAEDEVEEGRRSGVWARGTDTAEYAEAFEDWLRSKPGTSVNTRALNVLQRAATMQVGLDDVGGYLAPPVFMSELVKRVAPETSILGAVRTIPIGWGTPSIMAPSITGGDNQHVSGVRVQYDGETAATSTDFRTGQESIVPVAGVAYVDASYSLINGVPNSGALIGDLLTTEFARNTEDRIVAAATMYGGSIKSIIDDPNFLTKTTTATGAVGYLDYANLESAIGTQYGYRKWAVNNFSKGAILTGLLDNQNRPIFSYGLEDQNLASPRPDVILGKPVLYSVSLPEVTTNSGITAGTIPVLFGDFSAYWLARTAQMTVETLDQAAWPNIRVALRFKQGGRLVYPWMLKGMKIKS